MCNKKLWCAEEVTKMLELRKAGVKTGEIAKIIGRSRKAVRDKIFYLDFERRTGLCYRSSPTILSSKRRSNKKNNSRPEVMKKQADIRRRSQADSIKCARNRFQMWTNSEIDRLLDMRKYGATQKEMALKLGRTFAGVHSKLRKLEN